MASSIDVIYASPFSPPFFVGLMFFGRLTSEPIEGLAIFVPVTTLIHMASLMGPPVSFALMAELFDFRLFRDLI